MFLFYQKQFYLNDVNYPNNKKLIKQKITFDKKLKLKEVKVYEIEELKQKTIEELTKKLEERIENIENVIDKKALVEQSEDSINVKLVYTVLENIGIEEKLIF